MDILKKSRNFIGLQMKDQMIKNSVFAGIVFIIVAHPQTFKLVDSVIKVHNKNLLLLVHAVVVSLIMYFGSLYLFIPAQKVLLEGVKNKSVWSDMKKEIDDTEKYAEKNRLPTGIPSGGTDHVDAKNDTMNVSKKEFGDSSRKEIEEIHEKFNNMTIKDAIVCLEDRGITGGDLDKATLREIRKCV